MPTRRTRRQGRDDSTVVLELTACTVTVVFHGNLFNLTPDERRLVSDLSTTIQNYTDKKTGPVEVKTA